MINILINGNEALATAMAPRLESMRPREGVQLRLWFIAKGDKAHTWNTYVHQICEGAATVFFIDGYACVREDSLFLIARRLAERSDALAATGVPSAGRSAPALRAAMLAQGGIHGNLYALSGAAIGLLRKRDFKLPVGLYRTDPLMGAVLMYAADPAGQKWQRHRIEVVDGATWDIDAPAMSFLSNLKASWKRRLRQAQGELENCATRDHLSIRKLAPGAMARDVRTFIIDWADRHPDEIARMRWRHPLVYRSLCNLPAADNRLVDVAPRLLVSNGTVRLRTS